MVLPSSSSRILTNKRSSASTLPPSLSDGMDMEQMNHHNRHDIEQDNDMMEEHPSIFEPTTMTSEDGGRERENDHDNVLRNGGMNFDRMAGAHQHVHDRNMGGLRMFSSSSSRSTLDKNDNNKAKDDSNFDHHHHHMTDDMNHEKKQRRDSNNNNKSEENQDNEDSDNIDEDEDENKNQADDEEEEEEEEEDEPDWEKIIQHEPAKTDVPIFLSARELRDQADIRFAQALDECDLSLKHLIDEILGVAADLYNAQRSELELMEENLRQSFVENEEKREIMHQKLEQSATAAQGLFAQLLMRVSQPLNDMTSAMMSSLNARGVGGVGVGDASSAANANNVQKMNEQAEVSGRGGGVDIPQDQTQSTTMRKRSHHNNTVVSSLNSARNSNLNLGTTKSAAGNVKHPRMRK